MGAAVALLAVNVGTLVIPLPANPIAILEFVHEKPAPAGVLTKVFAGTATPAQNARLGSAAIIGTGLTVTITASVDVQPAAFVVVTV